MSTLVVHVDGLLVETTDHISNESPLTHGVEFVRRIVNNWQGSSLFVAHDGHPDSVRAWLGLQGLRPTWVDIYQDMNPMERVQKILSSAGNRMTTLSMFISSSLYDATIMGGEGITSIHFIHPNKVANWGPEVGSGWEKRMQEVADKAE